MKELRSIFAAFMALLILSLSAGWGISQHFCQGNLQASSLFGEAEGCGMDAANITISDPHTATLSEKPCCDEQLVTVNIKDSLTLLKAKSPQPFSAAVTLAVFASVFLFQPRFSTVQTTWANGYSPPFVHRDIPVSIQSFLI